MKILSFYLSSLLVLGSASQVFAQENASSESKSSSQKTLVNFSGTIRAKYEWQTETGDGRFQVRTARVGVTGFVLPTVEYKAEIDLSDKGQIKMLYAWTAWHIIKGLEFTVGQMRVPFTIDAHRSPHEQYFPNRSFLAKQVGSVRDVGATLKYSIPTSIPIVLQAGLFNGSGLTNQDGFWTNSINFSSKAQISLPQGWCLSLSVQKIRPENTNIMMYDGGLYWEKGPYHLEGEYLYKVYSKDVFPNVRTYNIFAVYDIPLKRGPFKMLSPLIRYDYMDNHSDGKHYLNGEPDPSGSLVLNDARRGRLTAGLTLSFDKNRLKSQIRLNYEKYFYDQPNLAKVSEKDKLVLEFMTHF